ncbi:MULTISPECIES: ABC transporter substrate-binding protein [Rhizobium]|uniref:Extracellular solute-binding protein n=1 Tax=Rhizobium changzhiense TaxID=2692317 RepID=A0A7Z0ZW90_9HYPH|nr:MULTISPECIES: extracellular solute-binding protein [Rhizobium]MBA5800402.1 extracellular solute-binding protein [Rhizobium changzhiense]MCW0019028.1 extracellular solute-binding protein [Rhizobium sp. BT-226]NNU48992.1 extracellular solute-binding protein [Rhizobium changzhiense]NZD66112.1 extracellular solute-binding protein [Rhizobium changzhiense]
MTELTRRNTMKLMSAALIAGVSISTLPRKAFSAGSITVLNWQGYGTDEAWSLKAFTEKTGIKVVHDYYSSESEMLTKMRTNPGAYDLVILNAARCAQAVAEDLLQPIDFSKVPNASTVDETLRANPNFSKDGKGYAVPWVWGMTSLAIREGMTVPDSYAVLADPAYKGRVAMDDDAIINVGVGALMSGQDINDPKDLAAVTAALKSIKPNVKLLWSTEDQWNKSFAAKEFDLSLFWSGGSVRSKRVSKLPVQFVVPKEGGVGWVDGLGVPTSAPNPEGALAFVNWMIDPTFYVEWATKIGAPASSNSAALSALPADDLTRLVHKTEYLKTTSFVSGIPDDRREAFNNIWQEVKAFYAE